MKPIHRVIVAAVLVVVVASGIIVMSRVTPPDDLDLSRSKPSDNKTYLIAVAPEKEPLAQGELHSWVLTLTVPDGAPVEGAKITIGGGMPQHGHGLPTSPQVTAALAQGRYRIEGVKFNMSGWWVLKFAISAPPGDDHVTFNLVL